MILEACVGNLQEAINAEKQGAHQIELCDRLDLDGTSPTLDTVRTVCEILKIPIKVIINPNPFDYIYTRADITKIKDYIRNLNTFPLAGIVFGPIDQKGLPDLDLLQEISEFTHLPITFHKAIDATHDIPKCTKMLVDQDVVKFILSSGGKQTADEGKEMLKKMKTISANSHIQIIGAGRITSSNLSGLHKEVDLKYYHGKKIVGDLA